MWRMLMTEDCRLWLLDNSHSERRGGPRGRRRGGRVAPMGMRQSIVSAAGPALASRKKPNVAERGQLKNGRNSLTAMDLNAVAGSSAAKKRSQSTGRDAQAWPRIRLVQSSVAGEASGWPTRPGW